MLSRALFENFKCASNNCVKLVPDQLDPQQRSEVFNSCAMAFIGGLVNTLCTFGNTTKDFENIVVAEVKARFKFIRDNEAKLQNERLEEAQRRAHDQAGKIIP